MRELELDLSLWPPLRHILASSLPSPPSLSCQPPTGSLPMLRPLPRCPTAFCCLQAPGSHEMLRARHMSIHQVTRLEELWRSNPTASGEQGGQLAV